MTENLLDQHELAILRRVYARQMLALSSTENSPLEAAFASVAREAFLGVEAWSMISIYGPQKVPDNDPVYAYQDVLIALAPERGVNNGSPSLHARLLDALAVHPGQTITHIGAGTGYYTAILAELVGASGRVIAVEFDERLAQSAQSNLAERQNVTVIHGDGAEWPCEACDCIYVNFAVARPADAWLEHLKPGGKLLFPLGVPHPSAKLKAQHAARGVALLIERKEKGLSVRKISPSRFVLAEGALSGNADIRAGLFKAFENGGADFVKSLNWIEPGDPARCWFWTPQWSLSYDPIED
jgi:protein-L-isoaspartate(D-aspartate) O-methyltransferase